jgi:hypothetical protein
VLAPETVPGSHEKVADRHHEPPTLVGARRRDQPETFDRSGRQAAHVDTDERGVDRDVRKVFCMRSLDCSAGQLPAVFPYQLAHDERVHVDQYSALC